MTVYQVMPPLSGDDFDALKVDIAERGVLVPIEYDDDGNVLDGHHRLKACAELGITEWPRIVRSGLSEEAKRQHARQLNLARRHLDRAQKRALIADQLKETPEKSNRQIAAALGVDDKTVAAEREEAEARAEIPHVSKTVDKSGRYQEANRPPKQKPPSRTRVVVDPEFQADAEAEARAAEDEREDRIVQAGERIALAGADGLVEDIEKLRGKINYLDRRVATLMEENASLKYRAKMWEQRAIAAGWKGRGDAA